MIDHDLIEEIRQTHETEPTLLQVESIQAFIEVWHRKAFAARNYRDQTFAQGYREALSDVLILHGLPVPDLDAIDAEPPLSETQARA